MFLDEALGAAIVAFVVCAAILGALALWIWAIGKFARAQHPIAAIVVGIGGAVVLGPVLLFVWVLFAHFAG
ncbi:hypothetical protein [Caulobacter sp. 17J65-9]|uniref:hypothetical protein n=1 Tax=Caulobacter sp. 17J65-9 TaxID=2709382 RepID=UPI0013C76ECE|nr:hypothetical protein [Caulobacter sp. 17J65-9]NEX94790.1 hypothetical protein [Caulobacter sp. 17J65-9]